MANSTAENGGARSTNGRTEAFETVTCPLPASAAEFDLTSFTQIYIGPETFARRMIIQDDNTDIATNIVGATSFLIPANETPPPIDCAGDTRNLYISTESGGTATSDGIRLAKYNES